MPWSDFGKVSELFEFFPATSPATSLDDYKDWLLSLLACVPSPTSLSCGVSHFYFPFLPHNVDLELHVCLLAVSSTLCLGTPPSAADRLMVSYYKGLAELCVYSRSEAAQTHDTLCTLCFAPSRLQALTKTACPVHACYAFHHCQIVHHPHPPAHPILSLSSFFTHACMHMAIISSLFHKHMFMWLLLQYIIITH